MAAHTTRSVKQDKNTENRELLMKSSGL